MTQTLGYSLMVIVFKNYETKYPRANPRLCNTDILAFPSPCSGDLWVIVVGSVNDLSCVETCPGSRSTIDLLLRSASRSRVESRGNDGLTVDLRDTLASQLNSESEFFGSEVVIGGPE